MSPNNFSTRNSPTRNLSLIGATALFGLWTVPHFAVAGPASSGVTFNQESFDWATDTDSESVDGEVNTNLSQLDSTYGVSGAGFLNIATSSGWVVQNMYVANTGEASGLLLPNADGTTDSSLPATVNFSAAPVSSFTNSSPVSYAVGQDAEDPEGFGASSPAAGYKPTEAANTLSFGLNPVFSFNFQAGHGNIQAARNQCFPAAVANSLAWLRTNYALNFTQSNGPGLGNVNGNGMSDGTIVGALDVDMNRGGITSRSTGNPVDSLPGLMGKLKFLTDNNISNVVTNYQGTMGNGGALQTSYTVMTNGNSATANSQGGTVTAAFIQSEIAAGEDVEMGFIYPGGGGHFVEITGAGSVGGIPWITYLSDHKQTDVDPTDMLGTNQTDFSFLNGTTLVNEPGMPNMTFLISESVVPEPASLGLLVMSGIMLTARRRKARS